MMATARDPEEYELPPIIELTDEEARRIFDERARESFGISGEEFLRRWDAGELEDADHTALVRMALMIPLMGRSAVVVTNPSPDVLGDCKEDVVSTSSEMQYTEPELPPIVRLTDTEAKELFDRQARRRLGISGEEFLRKWDAGEIEDPDDWDVTDLSLLIPMLGRPIVLPDER